MFKKISKFFKEVQEELLKVTWPTRNETIKYTLIVIAFSAVVALFLGAVDLSLSKLIQIILKEKI